MVLQGSISKIKTSFPSPDPTYLNSLNRFCGKTQTCQIYPRLIKKNQRIQEYRIGGRSDPEIGILFSLPWIRTNKKMFSFKKVWNEPNDHLWQGGSLRKIFHVQHPDSEGSFLGSDINSSFTVSGFIPLPLKWITDLVQVHGNSELNPDPEIPTLTHTV